MRRRRAASSSRRSWLWATVATIGVVTVAVVSFVVSRGRAEAADLVASRASAALAAARGAEARRWAGDELTQAERFLRQAAIERRRQDVRWGIPDYTEAEQHWRAAEEAATTAATVAVARRRQAEFGAGASIAAAREAIAQSEKLSATIYAGSGALQMLAEARLRLSEARIYQRNGDFTQAAVSADEAFARTRRMDEHTSALLSRYADARLVRTWQQWKRETIAWSRARKRAAVVVSKEQHRVTLYVNGNVHKVYDADLGFNWVVDKQVSGDGATPEGRYRVVQEKRGGGTLYYKALLLDYPNAQDRREFAAGRRAGFISSRAAIGGLIEIHGEGGRRQDWTKGCIALANRNIDELMRFVKKGTPVTIIGSDGIGALASLANEPKSSALGR